MIILKEILVVMFVDRFCYFPSEWRSTVEFFSVNNRSFGEGFVSHES